MANRKRIILGVTGSIAAYKSAELVRRLVDKDFRVSVVMTDSAKKFITPLTLSSLSGESVYSNMFPEKETLHKMPHIDLAQEADLILIAPATANIIFKLAYGVADSLLSCIVLAAKVKILVAPAMNTNMYNNKVVQENCKRLKDFGVKIINPIEGNLACGTSGVGHIADDVTIVSEVLSNLNVVD